MIIKFKIFERKDLDIAESIRELTNSLLKELYNFLEISINNPQGVLIKKDIDDELCIKIEINNIILSIRNNPIDGGAYHTKSENGSTRIQINNELFFKKIEEINREKNIDRKNYILKTINFDVIKKVLYHELTHRWDKRKKKFEMIKEFILFEKLNQGKPEKGDYVIAANIKFYIGGFIRNLEIGKVDKLKVSSRPVPAEGRLPARHLPSIRYKIIFLDSDFAWFYEDEIKYWSKDKEDLIPFLDVEKFGL